MTQHTSQRAVRGAGLAALLATAALLGACGGGGGGSSGGGDGGASPTQPPVETVPDSAMSSTSNFMRFLAAWRVDDTVEPFELSAQPPPRDEGDARPVGN